MILVHCLYCVHILFSVPRLVGCGVDKGTWGNWLAALQLSGIYHKIPLEQCSPLMHAALFGNWHSHVRKAERLREMRQAFMLPDLHLGMCLPLQPSEQICFHFWQMFCCRIWGCAIFAGAHEVSCIVSINLVK